MRSARHVVNLLFSRTSARLAELSPEAAEDAYRIIHSVAAFAGRRLEERVDPRVLSGIVALIADALGRTPYGSSLEFEYPLVISLSASSYCPFSCSNCYSNSGAGREPGHRLPRMEVFAKVAAAKTPFVILSGGEPLMAEGIEDCLRLLLDSGKFVFVSTNARVEPHLELARRNEGQLRFILPIWGDRARHDARRGANSFKRVEGNLAALNGVGVQANLLVVLCDDDLSALDEVEYLVSAHKVKVVTVSRRIDVGRMDDTRFALGQGHLDKLAQWRKRLLRHVRSVVLDLPEVPSKTGLGKLQGILGLPAQSGCSAGNWMMHIDDSGRGFPCFSFETYQQHASAKDLTIAEQWSAARALRSRHPSGALCVEGLSVTPKKEVAV